MRHMEIYEGPHELVFSSAPNQLTTVTLLLKLASQCLERCSKTCQGTGRQAPDREGPHRALPSAPQLLPPGLDPMPPTLTLHPASLPPQHCPRQACELSSCPRGQVNARVKRYTCLPVMHGKAKRGTETQQGIIQPCKEGNLDTATA